MPLLALIHPVSNVQFSFHSTPFFFMKLIWLGDTVPLIYLTMFETPFGILGLCAPPIHHFVRRANKHGWRSLFSTKSYEETKTYDSRNPSGRSGYSRQNDSKTNKSNHNTSTKNVLAPSEKSSMHTQRSYERDVELDAFHNDSHAYAQRR